MKRLEANGPDLSDAELAKLYDVGSHDELFLRLNFVATVDGSAHGPDGLSGTINTPTDNRVFGMLRGWADVVLVGSGTVNAESYQAPEVEKRWRFLRTGRPAAPELAVLSRSGQLPDELDDAGGRVFAVESAGPDGMTSAVEELRRMGHRRVLCEGGPTIAGRLLSAGLVDELCLSIVPRIVVGDAGRITVGETKLQDWAMHGILEGDGTLVTRWRPTTRSS